VCKEGKVTQISSPFLFYQTESSERKLKSNIHYQVIGKKREGTAEQKDWSREERKRKGIGVGGVIFPTEWISSVEL